MTEGHITLEKRGHVLMMGLDRVAKRNAFDVAMFVQLARAFGQLENDTDLRCGVLFAHGEHFTGGIDLAEWTPLFASGQWPNLPDDALDPLGLFGAVRTKPIVIAVQGYCYTIGIELLLACDIRVATHSTRFAQIEIKRGIYPVGGATIRLPMEVGWGNAMRYLLTGDEFSAEDAYRIGMVQELVPAGEQTERAYQLAETIAQQAPLGVYATLKNARLTRHAAEQSALTTLMPDLIPIMASNDAREGLASFLERRPARFSGQ